MTPAAALLLVLAALLVAALPVWRYSRGWGVVPSGSLAVLLAIVGVLLLMGRE